MIWHHQFSVFDFRFSIGQKPDNKQSAIKNQKSKISRMIRHLVFWPVVVVLFALSCAPQDDLPRKNAEDKDDGRNPSMPVVDNKGPLKDRLKATLEHVHARDLQTDYGFWTIFHGVLGMGLDTDLTDPDTRKKIKFIDAIRTGVKIDGMEFDVADDGVDVRIMPGSGMGQGHQDQFIAEMAQWGMKLDQKFLVRGKEYTFADFCRYSRARASVDLKDKQELSWAIIIIGEFYGTDARWTNNQKPAKKLRFEDVVRYELNQPIDTTAACGGTHRLFGLTWAYHRYLQKGGNKAGLWQDVADKIELFKQNAKKYQNRDDGSFSTNYVSDKGSSKDVQTQIGSTGHVFEWLALALAGDELLQPWVQEAAISLCNMILRNQRREIEGGALYHATHGLHIYYDRLFGELPGFQRPLIPLPPKN